MSRLYFIILVIFTLAFMFFTFFFMWKETHQRLPLEKPVEHPVSPYKSYIFGVGIVEASSDNISIGTPVNRIIDKVLVTTGMNVKKGDVLFQLEDRDLQSLLLAKHAAYKISLAKLKKLEALPRTQDVLISETALKSAQVELNQAQSQFQMTQGLKDPRALSKEEVNRRRFNYEQAESKLQQAQAQFEKIKSGTWQPDLEIAHLEMLQAKAEIEKVETEIQRTIIRSPINGKVLQIRIHEGEFPPMDSSKNPLMIVGNTKKLHLQVSINQYDAPYFNPKAPAVAFLRGDARIEFPIEFVELEPYLVSKQNLTNDITEKVDTRVLRITYRFKEQNPKVYVGQQMDVYIEAEYPQ